MQKSLISISGLLRMDVEEQASPVRKSKGEGELSDYTRLAKQGGHKGKKFENPHSVTYLFVLTTFYVENTRKFSNEDNLLYLMKFFVDEIFHGLQSIACLQQDRSHSKLQHFVNHFLNELLALVVIRFISWHNWQNRSSSVSQVLTVLFNQKLNILICWELKKIILSAKSVPKPSVKTICSVYDRKYFMSLY